MMYRQYRIVYTRDTNQAIFSYCYCLLLLQAIIIASNIYCAILQYLLLDIANFLDYQDYHKIVPPRAGFEITIIFET